MIKRFTLLLTALLVSVMFASIIGGSAAGAAVPSSAGVRWEAAVKLQPEAAKLALLDRSAWTESMRMLGISAGLKDGWLSMQGQKDLTQLSTALFDTSSTWMDFLGGAVELTIHLPSDGKPVTLNLEARNTTGYTWEVLPGDYVQEGESTFAMRYRGVGVPSIQTIRLAATRTGDTSINLLYHRIWETSAVPHAQVSIWMPGSVSAIDLSDPTPAVLKEKESSESGNNDAYAALDELKTVLPASFDWRTQGIVPAVRDQANCGSCWAFGTIGVMESAIKKAGGPLTNLSEQFLISCNKDSWDCNGGLTATKYHYNVLGYNQTVAGAVLESAKPYTATNGTCPIAYNHPYKATGWQFITGSEWTMPTNDQIKTAIYTYGPVTAGVCVDNGWYGYSSGVYIAPANVCSGSTNHQIVLVGWDDATSTWILRNSWGPGWGESGYMHIRWDPAGTRSRVGEGTSWVRYTPPAAAFDSQFNGTSTGWSAVKGAWSIYNSMYYRSNGVVNGFATAKRTGIYGNSTYEARMKRSGICTACGNFLLIRGDPSPLDSVGNWNKEYQFIYTNTGLFSVWKVTGTSIVALKTWTTSAAIVQDGWNTLKVRAYGSSLKFYINGTLVWSGIDTALTSGQVGLGFYRDASAGTLLVDWAKLTPINTDENPFFNFELVVPGIEQSGGNVNMSP